MKEKTALFNFWVSFKYYKLINELVNIGAFNFDVFHDTLLTMYDSAMQAPAVDLSFFDAQFGKLYKEHFFKHLEQEKKHIHFETFTFEFILVKYEETAEADNETPTINVKRVMNFITLHCTPEDKSIFVLFVTYPGLSYKELGIYAGKSQTFIYNKINSIKQLIKTYLRL